MQYIDSNTPEHTVPVVATSAHHQAIFTSVQIHEEPIQFERREKPEVTTKENGSFERYSYPCYGVREPMMNERHSLPPETKMTVDDEHLTEVGSSSKTSLDNK